jgi:hypothetical protein
MSFRAKAYGCTQNDITIFTLTPIDGMLVSSTSMTSLIPNFDCARNDSIISSSSARNK